MLRSRPAYSAKYACLKAVVAVTPTPIPEAHTEAPIKPSTTPSTRRKPPQSTGNANTKPSYNVANTGLRKSQRHTRQEPSPQAPQTYAKLPQPPLNQDSASFEDFFQHVDKISSTIDPANQTPLAAMFITGLAEREDQDAIVEELSKKSLSTVLGNGQVEMKCNWNDLKKVLKAMRLVGAKNKGVLGKRGKK